MKNELSQSEEKNKIPESISSEIIEHSSYLPPVDQLLTLGQPEWKEWRNYAELGIGPDQIPDLIRIAIDLDLQYADSDSSEIYAPIHARRALTELRAEAAIEPLIALFDRLDESDDWGLEELPQVLGKIGPATIPALSRYLLEETEKDFLVRHLAAIGLREVVHHFPESRSVCLEAISNALKQFRNNHFTFNGFLIADLMHLEGIEAISVVEQAFQENCVDESIAGDLEDVQIALGLKMARETPRRPFRNSSFPSVSFEELNERFEEWEGTRVRTGPKIGRNDPCLCGSGKKYKKCCLR